MPFSTALSGLKAASNDLKITGNNIANASTTGFKESRSEFADVYSANSLGSGSQQIGSGVQVGAVSQQFDQGTISFTSNSLDVAIDGEGFFVLNNEGATTYSRAGVFGLDKDGFIVNNGGARLQGFEANDQGTIGGILGDVFIETGNLSPRQTTSVESLVNLDAEAPILAQFGTTISSLGPQIGVAQGGVAIDTPSVLATSAAPTPFDFSVNSSSAITANSPLTPFDFSVNNPSAVTGTQAVVGHDFSINSPSTLSSLSAPTNFNFANKSSAVKATAAVTGFDFGAAGANASFDVTIANGSGGNGNTTVTVNLTTSVTDITSLLNDINDDLVGIDVVAVENPPASGLIEFQAAVAGESSTVTVGNFVPGGGGVTAANVQAALGNIADGSASSGSTFNITIAGGSVDGTATINLNANVTSFQSLLTDIQDQLTASGFAVDVRSDPSNSGRLQFFSTDDGVATTLTVDSFVAGTSDTTANDITNLLGVTDGATSIAPGTGAIGATGSLTESTFDITIANGSGVGGNRTVTINLDQNIANGDLDTLVSVINAQLNGIAAPGIDVRAQEDPNNAGLLQFYSTVAGESSTVTVDNFQISGIAGDDVTSVADVVGLLGGLTDGSSASNGSNTAASFEIRLSGGSDGTANQTQVITLDSNVQTLQDLITDIRDDLATTGIGLDVREDPARPGQGILQFFATVPGEGSEIEIDPRVALTLGNSVTQANVENVLGRIQMGASNSAPDPSGFTGATGEVGNLSAASFDITLAGATSNNGGPITINLDTDIQSLDDLINDIQDELRIANIGVDVREDPENAGRLQFFASVAGEASTITVNNLNAANPGVTVANLADVLNLATGVTEVGVAAVDNGYPTQIIDVVNTDDPANPVTTTVTTLAGESAAELAARFNDVSGVSASASTSARLPSADYLNNTGNLAVTINGVRFTSPDLATLATDINNTNSFQGISAEVDTNTGDLLVTAALGNDLVFAIDSTDVNDSLSVQGANGQPAVLDLAGGDRAASIGGTVDFILDENVTLANADPDRTALFGALEEDNFTEFQINSFDPNNQETYNSATSVTVFDSLGNSHVMTQYFVKEPFRPDEVGSQPNRWTMYVQIDGVDVGDPDPTLAPPQNTLPTQAGYTLQFNEAGQLVDAETPEIHITNWTPTDAEGNATGALGPVNVLAGAQLPVPNDPPISSNFVIDLNNSTQFGSVFSVSSVSQDGFTTGQLSGLDISDTGVIFARYTNGENQVLGQVALANFANVQGLKNLGGSGWAETFESGEPVVGSPRSASLGALNSGALEDSNVELSDQLVNLIIAQRNFQASAKTIETVDAVTQTIMNLR
jgi:flagellar hook protein FlgE